MVMEGISRDPSIFKRYLLWGLTYTSTYSGSLIIRRAFPVRLAKKIAAKNQNSRRAESTEVVVRSPRGAAARTFSGLLGLERTSYCSSRTILSGGSTLAPCFQLVQAV